MFNPDFKLNLNLNLYGSTVRGQVFGTKLENFVRKIQSLDIRGKDMYSAMQEVGEYMMDVKDRNFAEQGNPKWKMLAYSTIKDRIRKGYTPIKILYRTGELQDGYYFISSRRQMRIYNDVTTPSGYNLAGLHQFGWIHHKSGRKVPARPPITAQQKDQDHIFDIFKVHLYGK